jgi:adenylate cyclase
MSFFAELKRRNVFRVGLFYVVAAWLVIEVAETVLPLFDVPDGVLRGLVVLLVLGFVPALVFSWIFELTPEGLKRDAEARVAGVATEQAGRKLNLATLVVATLAIGLFAYDRMAPAPVPTPAPAATAPPAATDPGAPVAAGAGAQLNAASIAVLPFADLSPAGDQEYFSDGMAEEILNALVKVDGLQVTSRTSSFAFKGQQNLGLKAIAGQLAVRHVLEGSVRRAGGTLRITAQLIDADVDRHLWSDTFDRPLTAENIFAIQDEIATAIVAALVKSLGLDSVGEVTLAMPTADLAAYDLYLRARAHFQARSRLDAADELLERALEQDPQFAKAWELRAALQGLKREYGYSDLGQDELDRLGVEYARQALAIEPASGLALGALGFLKSRAAQSLRAQHDIAGTLQDFERALEIDPRNSSTLNWLGLAYGFVGKLDKALETFRRCMEHDPLFAPCAENEYETLLTMGRPEQGYAHFQAALDKGTVTAQYINFRLLAQSGQKDFFMFVVNQSHWLPGWRRYGAIWDAYQDLAGDHTALVEEIRQFAGLEAAGPPSELSALLIPLGAYDLVPEYPLLMWGPDHAGYRRSPQFRHYIHQSGVYDYWRAHGFPPQCRPVGADGFECD